MPYFTATGCTGAPDRLHEGVRRRLEEEGVHTVVRAVGGQRFQLEVLSLDHPHLDQVEQVDGEEQIVALAREHLEAHRVRRDCGHVVPAEPANGVHTGPGGAAPIALLVPLSQELDVPRPDQHDVARLHLDASRGLVEIVGRDRVAAVQSVDALRPGDVQEHAPTHEAADLVGSSSRDAPPSVIESAGKPL